MTTLDLRAMPRDERGRLLVGEGSGYDTSRYQYGHDTFPHEPTIRERIYAVVLASGGAVSRTQIAKALGLRKTPWLISSIESLVMDGYLGRQHHAWKNGALMYLYEVK